MITKGDVHEIARDPPSTSGKRRLIYLGHILRLEPDSLVKRTLLALTKGGTLYSEGSLFMDVVDRSFTDVELLAKDKKQLVTVEGLKRSS